MPCFDGGGDWGGDKLTRSDVEEIINRKEHKHSDRVNKELFDSVATPLLCEAVDLLEQNGLLKKCSPTLREWYKRHTEDDVHRIKVAIREDDFEVLNELDERERRLYKEIGEGKWKHVK